MAKVTRILVYEGPEEWITKVLESGNVPAQGKLALDGASISSGLVLFGEEVVNQAPIVPPPQGPPPPSTEPAPQNPLTQGIDSPTIVRTR